MIEKLAEKFVRYQVRIGSIQEKDAVVYQYGYAVLAEVFLNVWIGCLIGNLMDQIKETAFFLCMFIPLRSFCGGYHARTEGRCIILSNLCMTVVLFLSRHLVLHGTNWVFLWISELVAGAVIVSFSPVGGLNKRLFEAERKRYKLYAIAILAVQILLEYYFLLLDFQRTAAMLFLIHMIQAVSLLMVVVKTRQVGVKAG